MKAILLPQDISKPIRIVTGDTYLDIAKTETNIRWIERVNTQALYDLHCAAALDESGVDSPLHTLNLRARVITEYPGPLFGDVLIFGETRGSDITFINVPGDVFDKLVEKVRQL